jgi:hypothetical protein
MMMNTAMSRQPSQINKRMIRPKVVNANWNKMVLCVCIILFLIKRIFISWPCSVLVFLHIYW